jgi:DNA-binding NarL/FixJ family response regulator
VDSREENGRSQQPEERRTRDPIRVVLVDDQAFFRLGLRALLTGKGIVVVGEASSGEQALDLVTELMPDVVVMDLSMEGIGGLEATRRMTAQMPLVKVLVVSISDEDDTVVDAVAAGACGYVVKDSPPEQFATAVRSAYAGTAPISPKIAALLLERLRAHERERAQLDLPTSLSERELEVLRLLGEGKDNPSIAAELFLSTSTVKSHISNILAKLQIENRIQAAVYASKKGLI